MLDIEISKIAPEGSRYEGEEPQDIMDVTSESHLRPAAPVSYDLYVQVVSQRLVVRGLVSTVIEMECARCTDFFSTTLRDSSFLRAYEIDEGVESIDITDDLREAMLLLVPSFPVCGQACKGLCSQCGKNLNKGSCGCSGSSADMRWDALNSLDLDNRAE